MAVSITVGSPSLQTFGASDAECCHSAYVAMLIGYSVKWLMVVVLCVYVDLANQKRDREAAAGGTLMPEQECEAPEKGMHDDNRRFRSLLW